MPCWDSGTCAVTHSLWGPCVPAPKGVFGHANRPLSGTPPSAVPGRSRAGRETRAGLGPLCSCLCIHPLSLSHVLETHGLAAPAFLPLPSPPAATFGSHGGVTLSPCLCAAQRSCTQRPSREEKPSRCLPRACSRSPRKHPLLCLLPCHPRALRSPRVPVSPLYWRCHLHLLCPFLALPGRRHMSLFRVIHFAAFASNLASR